MGNFFDSAAANTGEALSGAANSALAGYVQGMQLKQQMQKAHQELMNPHITALAHGAYLVQNPLTGQIEEKLAAGALPGGPQNYMLKQFLEHPESHNILRAMGYVFAHSPEKMDAIVNSLTALAHQRETGAQANVALGGERTAKGEEIRAKTAEIPLTEQEKRAELQTRGTSNTSLSQLRAEQLATEKSKQGELGAREARTKAITQPDVNVRNELAKRNEQAAARLRQQIENDKLLTPARKELLEARARAADEAAKRHREAASAAGKSAKATENQVTIGMDALGRPYVKPTFKKPEDAKAFLNTYQQWTQPLKNLDVGIFGSKKESLGKIRATWIEKNHPTEAEIAGFDQAMREAQ